MLKFTGDLLARPSVSYAYLNRLSYAYQVASLHSEHRHQSHPSCPFVSTYARYPGRQGCTCIRTTAHPRHPRQTHARHETQIVTAALQWTRLEIQLSRTQTYIRPPILHMQPRSLTFPHDRVRDEPNSVLGTLGMRQLRVR